jgi:UDP-N-acetylglucosamine:LPS N-acetylglucosamine transferase
MQESARFLGLADQVLERFRPHVLLTYGGHPACLGLMRRARMKSVAVVFHLAQLRLQRSQGFCRRREADRENRSGNRGAETVTQLV